MVRLCHIIRFKNNMDVFREMMIDRKCEDPLITDKDNYKKWIDSIIMSALKENVMIHHKVINGYNTPKIHIMVNIMPKPKLADLRKEEKKIELLTDKPTGTKNLFILVSLYSLSSTNESFLNEFSKRGLKVQFIYSQQLIVNITKHVCVPKHTLVTKEETERIMKSLCDVDGSIQEVPIISRKDPIIFYYDFPVGSLVKIERHIPYIGHSNYYRLIK